MSAKVIVTGASGFIGTRMVRKLVEQGCSVVAIDILPPRERLDGVAYHQLDLRSPVPGELGQGVDRIYNFAAVHRTPGHPDWEYYQTNLAGALHVVALAEANQINTIVFTSSISVYGPSEQVVDETSPLNPVSAYGRSKRLAEQVHEQWRRGVEGRRLIVVRPAVVFGPGERGNYTSLSKALRGGYFFYPGRRDTVKSGGYVDELCSALDFALSRPDPYILFNFAYPDFSTTADIVAMFKAVTGWKAKPPTVPIFPLLAAATVFEIAAKFGLKTPIHRERVMKLVNSTKVAPGWLKSQGYNFKTDLKSALKSWSDETSGSFE